jgi:hypothetical protein
MGDEEKFVMEIIRIYDFIKGALRNVTIMSEVYSIILFIHLNNMNFDRQNI